MLELPTRIGAFGTVGGVVGTGWKRYYRFPHPAYNRVDDVVAPVPWSAVAALRGIAADISSASWFDVSGVRPHLGRPIPGATDEPLEGMHEQTLKPRLALTLAAFAGDATVWTARWLGYNEAEDLSDETADRVTVHHEVYVARRADVDRPGPWLATANYVWGDSGHWLLCANIGCMSTYVGVREANGLAWPDDVEVALVTPDMPVS